MTDLRLELRNQMTDLLGRAVQAAPRDAKLGWRFVRACLDSADSDRAIAALQSLIQVDPHDMEARRFLVDLLLGANRADEALAAARHAVAMDSRHSRVLSSYGFALRAVGADDEADDVFRTAFAIDPDNRYAARGIGQALIRRRAAAELLHHCESTMTRSGPRAWLVAQYLIAAAMLDRTETVARLLDYDRLVQERELPVPAGFDSLASFNEALAGELGRLRPLSNATVALDVLHEGHRLKDGPKAALAAFGPDGAPACAALLESFVSARRDHEAWLAASGESLHLRMRPHADRLIADAILTSRQGYLSLHTHACTWLSAVYYAAVPPGTGETSKAGCMEFAPPLHKVDLAEGIWPTRLVRPRPGLIVFFPAYLYHHVHANALEGERLVVTFDVMPAAGAVATGVSYLEWLGLDQE